MFQTMKTSVVLNGVTVEVQGLADVVVEGASVKVTVRSAPSYKITSTPVSPWYDTTTSGTSKLRNPPWLHRVFGEATR